MDFRTQNEGLLMKHLHKFYNKEDIPWVHLVWQHYPDGVPHASKLCGSFWRKDIMQLAKKYIPLCNIVVGSGDTAIFWHDKWNGAPLLDRFPRLHSFALDNKVSVQKVISAEEVSKLFELPLSQQAYQELISLQSVLQSVHLDPNSKDKWSTVWSNGVYTS